VLFVATLLLAGCDETLPTREVPEELLVSSLRADDAIFLVDSKDPSPGGTFFASARNAHSEVLVDTARAQATIDVWMESKPQYHETVSADWRNLVNPAILSGPLVVLTPDSAAVFRIQMTHRASDGTGFWTLVRSTRYQLPDGSFYVQTDPVYFRAKAGIQVFKNRVLLQTGEIRFSVVYKIY
jgi:hypothetical protein